jgi:protein-arginine kinase activator protein McsA
VVRLHGTTTDHKKGKNMKKVDIVDCVKQIIAINKELEEHDQRQDYHVTYMAELRNRIEKLEKLQASSSKQQG